MKRLITITATAFLLLFVAGAASAADWMTEDGGTVSCGAIRKGGTCWLTDITADSSAIVLQECRTYVIQVYGASGDIMPQTCTDTSCGEVEDLLSASLTGTSPNAFLVSQYPHKIIRIDWTEGGGADPTVSITCG